MHIKAGESVLAALGTAGIIGGLAVATLLPRSGAAEWKRQSNESCAEYGQRVNADNYALWREFSSVRSPRGPMVLRRYWVERQHGCRPAFPAWKEAPADSGLLFRDGFEAGDVSRWS